MSLRYGAPAPDFTLRSADGTDVSVGQFRGTHAVVLAFYCYDWGGI
jgi:peroxiredoxin